MAGKMKKPTARKIKTVRLKAKPPKVKTAPIKTQKNRPKPAPPQFAYYSVLDDHDLRILDAAPKGSGNRAGFNSFEEARDNAVDHLLKVIEHFERRLWEIKRAENYHHYLTLSQAER